MPNSAIQQCLLDAKTIAVVGLSSKPHRASHEVAAYLQKAGYKIIPVNPKELGNTILGEYCFGSLTEARAGTSLSIDIVNCFRNSDDIPPIVDEAIRIGAHCVWMQMGIHHEASAQKARNAGLFVVSNKCTKVEHARLPRHRVTPSESA